MHDGTFPTQNSALRANRTPFNNRSVGCGWHPGSADASAATSQSFATCSVVETVGVRRCGDLDRLVDMLLKRSAASRAPRAPLPPSVSTACVPAGAVLTSLGIPSIKVRRPISRNPVWQVPTVPPKVLSSIIGLARMQRRWWRRRQNVLGATGAFVSGPNRRCSTTLEQSPRAVVEQGFEIWRARYLKNDFVCINQAQIKPRARPAGTQAEETSSLRRR